MKIAIFTNNYLPNPFGVSGSVESFRKEFERMGHEVFVFAPNWKGYRDENRRVYRYPAIYTNLRIKFPLAIPFSQRISKAIENLDLDIIHSQHPNLLGTAALKWSKKKKIPIVFTWHTLYDQYAHFVPLVPQRMTAWWAIRNARNYANQCDQVIVPTPTIGEIIKKWGVTNENITAIPTGVEENQLENANGKKVREKYKIKDEDILLLVITRLTQEKNMNFLLECAMDIVEKNNKVKFLVGGDGNLEEKMKSEVQKRNLSEKIIFSGFVPNETKKDYYAAGDIFIFASKSETQGMILTEAMYIGLPIVAVVATGAQYIVEEGKTGFLVDENIEKFGNAVQRLIDDSALRHKFGEEAKKVAREKYTSKVCAERMLEVYEKSIKRKAQIENLKTTTQN